MNHNEEEQAVLGSIIYNNDNLSDVVQILKAEDFESWPHQWIYWAILDLDGESKPIDEMMIGSKLKAAPKEGDILQRCGGYAYLAELIDHVPSNGNAAHYAKIVKAQSSKRQAAQVAREIPNDTINQSIAKLEDIASQQDHESRPASTDEIAPDVLDELERNSKNALEFPGIQTGFKDVDAITLGLNKSDLIIMAARPAMGKTAFMLGQVLNAAENRPLELMMIFSMEMSKEQLLLRMLSSEAKVEITKLRMGNLAAEEWDRLAFAIDNLPRNVIIDDRPAMSIQKIKASMKSEQKRRGKKIGAAWIDYLQLGKSERQIPREQEISELSRGLKGIAKEFNIPVTALSQLNRELEKRQDKRPQMSDLRESGAIEQDADIIAFLYRDEVYNEDSADKGIAEVLIEKNRQGSTGKARLEFRGKYTQFRNIGG
jgi:replicative DNA helicase